MHTPIDYAGNGRIDPIEIGIASSLRDNDDGHKDDNPGNANASHGPNNAGCLTVVVALPSVGVLGTLLAML